MVQKRHSFHLVDPSPSPIITAGFLLGLTGGTFNLFGGLAGITIPVVIGHLAEYGNFAPALIFISCLALIGALSYIFLVGKVERIVVNE